MIEINPHQWLEVPRKLCVCPECFGTLYVDIEEWETGTRQITRAGFHIECEHEDWENSDTWHRHWQDEWQGTEKLIYNWLCNTVRVCEKPAGALTNHSTRPRLSSRVAAVLLSAWSAVIRWVRCKVGAG